MFNGVDTVNYTRMHSSRMRTGRSGWVGVWLCVCSGGGCLLRGGCLLWGVSALLWGGLLQGRCLLPQGACSGGCIPASTEADNPPSVNQSQTPVKTLPWPNFVAAGNNVLVIGVHILLPSKVTIFIFTHYFQSSNYSYAYRLET